MQRTRRPNDPRPIGEVVEDWLSSLDGPIRLAAFHEMPVAMQRGAWEALRHEIELEREGGLAA